MLDVRFAFVPVALFALACTESVESQDIRTSGVYPEIEVTADGSGSSKVEVLLKVGGDDSNTFLELTGEDTLEATVGDSTKTLDKSGNKYIASFPVDEEGTEFTIAFLRGDADGDAPASTVALPAPFELSLGATKASRADDELAYTWDPPASGSLDWSIEGDCIKLDRGSVPDDGNNALAAGSIDTFDSDTDETCTVGFTLTRSQTGSVDDAFTEGGRIVAKQVRSDSFSSSP